MSDAAVPKRIVHLLAYADMEVLDFAGPFEVFSVANELRGYKLFDIRVVGCGGDDVVRCRNGLRVICDHAFEESVLPDVLVVPGGNGSRALLQDARLRGHLNDMHQRRHVIISVCSGALLLAASGVLAGMKATTHHEVMAELQSYAHNFETVSNARYCDNGHIILSAGISAGIDACVHFLARDYGGELESSVRNYMEYNV